MTNSTIGNQVINGLMKKRDRMHEFMRKHLALVLAFVLVLMAGFQPAALAQNQGNKPGYGVTGSVANHNASVQCTKMLSTGGRQVQFTVSGQMPAQAQVNAVPVQRTAPQGKQVFGAYDITINNGRAEWQPQAGQLVTVSITDPNFTDGQMMDVYHEGANGNEFVATVSPTNHTITFPARSFSVYIVTVSGGDARLAVTFVQADGRTTIMVKKNDLDPTDPNDTLFNKIVYDLGAGEYSSDLIFRGWFNAGKNAAGNDYHYEDTDAANAKTIEGVRTDIKTVLNSTSGVTEGDTLYFYALLYKSFTVSYLDTTGTVLSSENYLKATNVDSMKYTVLQNFTLDDHHSLLGWFVDPDYGENIVGHSLAEHVYPNDTMIVITGDVVFTPYLPAGHWLVFDENGKGGKYNAPQFVLADDVTHEPCEDSEMTRYGYTFGGWYVDKDTTTPFSFGYGLEANTTIYAKWKPNALAPYTVIFWTQNQDRTDYEVKDSYSGEGGTVGQDIPYTVVENNAEDYVTDLGDYGHYTGFSLRDDCKNLHVTVTPEGDAVLNLYYDRIDYKFKFYLYRDGTQNNRYDYANNSGDGSSLNNLVTWHSNQTEHPSVNGYTIQSETVGGRTYYYFVMNAYYGEDISSKWPTYDQITGANNRQAVSFVMMVGTALKPTATNQGSGTVKGLITVLNENILGATNDSLGNYVVIRFPDNYNNWRYHIWFEAAEDGSYTITRVYNGKTYYPADTLVVRSSNTTDANQNEPKYPGFEYVTRFGHVSNQDDSFDPDEGHWTTTENGTTLYHLNYIYNREMYKISYFDGDYVDGRDNELQNRSSQLLHESGEIGQGIAISDEYKNYIPNLPEGEEGFVFEGWYLDEGCTQLFTWSTMPVGGIQVYAKWRQIQYRVFLKPNADRDENLEWGSENQAMNFRADYNATISVPTGTRPGYIFAGWYSNPECTQVFSANVRFNDSYPYYSNYDKTVDFTDTMDKWGDLLDEGQYCSDTLVEYDGVWKGNDRPWITKKVVLYAKWRKIVMDADGIGVEYVCGDVVGDCHQDEKLYVDNTTAIAESAPTVPQNADFVFSYWDLQRYDTESEEFVSSGISVFPGADFTVLIDNAKQTVINEDTSTYTIQLKAVYEPKENHTPTFIIWYENYLREGATEGDTVRVDGKADGFNPDGHAELHINQAVGIPVPTRNGYTFKGWHKHKYQLNEEVTSVYATCDANFLVYVPAEGVTEAHFTSLTGTKADSVAADEANPYDYLYAVWEPVVEVTLQSPYCVGAAVQLPATSDAPASVAGTWSLSDGTTGATINNNVFTATEAGDYTLVFTPSDGTCGQAVTKEVVVNPNPDIKAFANPSTICSGGESTLSATGGTSYMWDAYSPDADGKVTPTVTTTYHVTGTDAKGCVNTAEVTVNVNPVVVAANINDQEVCKGSQTEVVVFALTETPTEGTVTWAWTNDNTDIGLAGSGSDNLSSFTATNNGTEPISALITVTPTYTYEGVSCPGTPEDFTITVNLTVTGDTTAVECEKFTWYGTEYTTSGDYEKTFTTVAGCDSIVTLHLTINPTYSVDTIAVKCEKFTWYGTEYITSGDYEKVFTTKAGCDSIVTLHLTINPLPELTITNKEQTITYGESIQTVVIENKNSTLSYTLPSAGFSASTVEGNVEIKSVGLLSVGTYKIPVEVHSDQDPDCGNVKDTIKVIVNPRPLIIRLTASKHYDGTKMVFDQSVFEGTSPAGVTVTLATVENLASGDYLAAGHIETEDSQVGVYTCTDGYFGYMMDMAAIQTGFVVNNADHQNVNANYTPQFYVTLTILEPDAYIECVAQNISLADCQPYATIADVQQPEIIGGTGNVSDYILTPSIAEGTPLAMGENLITWTLYTAAGAQLATCEQTVTVNYPPCDPILYQGHTYPVARIGSQCWLAENLRNTKYDDNLNEGGDIENYRPVNDDESTVNAYGYLYSWYSAVGVEEGNNDAEPTTFTDECNGEYIQGACPEGWAVPSQADVNQLRAAIEDDASMLKDFAPQYWLPGANGVNPNTGFNAHAGGHYNSAAGQFEGRLLYAYFWEADSQPGASQVISVVIAYYCSNPFEIISSKNDLRPVRCVRKQITAPEEQEPFE